MIHIDSRPIVCSDPGGLEVLPAAETENTTTTVTVTLSLQGEGAARSDNCNHATGGCKGTLRDHPCSLRYGTFPFYAKLFHF